MDGRMEKGESHYPSKGAQIVPFWQANELGEIIIIIIIKYFVVTLCNYGIQGINPFSIRANVYTQTHVH